MKHHILLFVVALVLSSCSNKNGFDATGTFEATEVTVSAESQGKLISLSVNEGDTVEEGRIIGVIDSVQLYYGKKQLEAQQSSLLNSRPDIAKQVSSLREQIEKQKKEQLRTEKLVAANAATTKQLDDIRSQISVLENQLQAALSTLVNNTASINDNAMALNAQIESLEDKISKCRIISPLSGTVLAKYVEQGEIVTIGKAVVKIADMDKMYLRAYFTSEQLSEIKLGDHVAVIADFGRDERYEYDGEIFWISSKSEFTPKTIQTKDSRANLVYATKIAVSNDGRLKIGLYGEVKLK